MLGLARTLRGAWGLALLYSLGVILFGAWVRISGSGDGCGQHWPSCQGELVHLPRKVETIIELTHRVTSGFSLLLVLGLGLRSHRQHPRGHAARSAATWAMLFIVGEALVGAAIVLLRKTGNDTSISRAVIMAVHLVNTCWLTYFLLWAARTSGVSPSPRFAFKAVGLRPAWYGVAVLLLVSAAGAVTALGDTVFPVADHFSAGLDVTDRSAHFLERVRGFHPLLAIFGAAYLLVAAPRIGSRPAPQRAVMGLVWLQLGLGVLNIGLSAPGWMQLVHLGVANLLWLSWVWLLLDAAEEAAEVPTPTRSA